MYSKHFYEEYARLTLVEMMPDIGNNLYHSDKPDLQTEDDSCGIEVTGSTPESEQKTSAYGEKQLGTFVCEEDKRSFFGEFFCNSEGRAFAFSPSDTSAPPQWEDNIIAAIKRKVKKANSYKKFKKNGLYIYSDGCANSINHQMILAAPFDPFDFVVINFFDTVCFYQDNQMSAIEVSTEQLEVFKAKSKQYEKEFFQNRLTCFGGMTHDQL